MKNKKRNTLHAAADALIQLDIGFYKILYKLRSTHFFYEQMENHQYE